MAAIDTIIVGAYLLLGAAVIAAMLWGTAQVSRFLTDHPMVRNAQDLEDFKIFVRRDMKAALTILPFVLILVVGSVYMLVQFGSLGFAINLAFLAPFAVVNGRLKPLVARARNLECASEELKTKHRRIAGIWKDNFLPRFESGVRVSRLGQAPLYVALAIALLALPAFWVVRSSVQGRQFVKADREAQERYSVEYQQWLQADERLLLRKLINVRGQPLSVAPEATASTAEGSAVSVDPLLSLLLENPEMMRALDLHRPTPLLASTDYRSTFGAWRFDQGAEDALGTQSIEPWRSKSRLEMGPRVPSMLLVGALVLREGTTEGDWLVNIPGSDACSWLYFGSGGEYCASSLRSWLAASVVGATSQWAQLDHEESDTVTRMSEQPSLDLAAALAELVSFDKDVWQMPPHPTNQTPVRPRADWVVVLKTLGSARQPCILTEIQTYRAKSGYSDATALIRLWDGNRFASVRLRPQDLEDAVVVVSEPFGGQRVVQMQTPAGIVYLDLTERRAFPTFKGWIDWARASERLWSDKGRSFPPNSARYPIG